MTRTLMTLFWLAAAAQGLAQPQPANPAAAMLISSTGVGEVKVNMSLAKLNALLPKPVVVKKANASVSDMDTVAFTYKGYNLVAEFYWRYIDENKGETAIYSLYCADDQLATKSGIKKGSDKFDIVKKLDGYNLSLYPNWRYEQAADKKRFSILTLQDGDAGTVLVMYFDNNKLYSFEVRLNEGC